MNDDPRFARVRMRAAGPMLSDLGLTPQRIADAASHLARAREVLDRTATELTDQICSIGAGAALVDAQQLVQAPDEIGLRVLAGILARVSGHTYRPRFERLERLFGLIRRGELGRGRTLHGCRIAPAKKAARLFGPGTISIFREERRAGAGNVSGRNFPHSGQT